MLKDAALLQLELTEAALTEGMTLKDAFVLQRSVARREPGFHRHPFV